MLPLASSVDAKFKLTGKYILFNPPSDSSNLYTCSVMAWEMYVCVCVCVCVCVVCVCLCVCMRV